VVGGVTPRFEKGGKGARNQRQPSRGEGIRKRINFNGKNEVKKGRKSRYGSGKEVWAGRREI